MRNDTPIITSATPTDFPGPLALNPMSPEQFTITLEDHDIEDILHVRVYRDYYKAPIGILDEKLAPNDTTGGRVERQLQLLTNNWCNGVTDTEGLLVFDVVVADRPFDDNTKEPLYRAVTENGRSSVRSWVGRCILPL